PRNAAGPRCTRCQDAGQTAVWAQAHRRRTCRTARAKGCRRQADDPPRDGQAARRPWHLWSDPSMNDIAVIADGEVYTEESYQQRLREQQDGLHAMFVKMRDQWIHHRAQSGVERRWKAAMELYYGDQDEQVNRFVETLEMGPRVRNAETPARSKVVVNIARPKCDQATARMAEILLPVDDRNWAIKPTPVPEIVGRIGDQRETFDPQTGQPTGLTADQEAQVLLEEARERAKRMQDHIDDNLTECNYNGELRSVLQNGVILGTGVIKGPFPINHENRAWIPREDGTHE